MAVIVSKNVLAFEHMLSCTLYTLHEDCSPINGNRRLTDCFASLLQSIRYNSVFL